VHDAAAYRLPLDHPGFRVTGIADTRLNASGKRDQKYFLATRRAAMRTPHTHAISS
jgi:hypothetical protein